MKIQFLFMLFVMLCSTLAEEPKSVLFIAGKPSHGPGEHEHHAGCQLLANALDHSGFNLKTSIHYDTWPDQKAFEGVDALVMYCDGNKEHLVLGHETELQELSDRGVGIVCLHYCVDGEPGLLNATLFNVIGGYYDEAQSKNPVWLLKDVVLADHPVTRGVEPFEVKDECYYNIKLGEVTPVLSAVPPGEDGELQVLAWIYGAKSFGFTGGHYHRTWANSSIRKLVLNAIVHAAGLDVPEKGVESETPIIAVNKSILHAIAKGDAADVKNHILLGADVNERNKQGWTPLHFTAVRGKTECARVLIKNGADVNGLTGKKKTALHFVADRDFMELAKLLLENKASIDAQDDEGWGALHYAAEKDHVKLAAYLIAQGAEVDMLSKRGGTPLHEASASASADMINLLLKNGADKTIQATNRKTPLDYAIELDNKPAAALLK